MCVDLHLYTIRPILSGLCVFKIGCAYLCIWIRPANRNHFDRPTGIEIGIEYGRNVA